LLINVTIELQTDDALLYTPDAAAAQVLAALGADPSNDYCTVHVTTSADPGSAGTPPTDATSVATPKPPAPQ
jgi:hypothetical protein